MIIHLLLYFLINSGSLKSIIFYWASIPLNNELIKTGEINMRKDKWDSHDISSQQGRVVIVTGASSGIGFEAARVLAEKEATVILAVRNEQKGEHAMKRIKQAHANADVSVMILDLASLDSVKNFADEFKSTHNRLDLLINNAGVMIPPYSKTADGFELQFGTNHLGHFALTALLFDLIRATPNSRIINVSSSAHKLGNPNFDDLQWESRKYSPSKAYGDSKIANLFFTYELAKRINENSNSPIVAAAHPGWTGTDLQRHSGLFQVLNKIFAQSPAMGALPTLYAAVAPDVKSAEYFGPSGFMEARGYPKKVDSNDLSKDERIAEKLWAVSEELTGVTFEI